jgi:hypothetical protein
MLHSFRPLIFTNMLFLVLLLAGCSGTPTRHLVSDVAMIKAGESTREDVLTLMGDPDSKRMVSPEVEEWVYYEEARSTFQNTPFVGGVFDPDGYNMVVVTLEGEKVTLCRYSGYDDDEFDWQDDYSWQETEKK